MNVRDLVPWSRPDRERNPPARTESLNPVLSLHREMNRLFDDVFRGFEGSSLGAGRLWPSVDVEESEKSYRVTAELPGMEERDIEVLLHEGVLTLRGEKKSEKQRESGSGVLAERHYGHFKRQIPLERDINENDVAAMFRNGVLTVTVPKSAQSIERTKRIPINSGNNTP